MRAAILQALPLAPDTLPALLERLRDVSPFVRLTVVARLFSVPMSLLTIRQRAELIGAGLRDRDAGVREASAEGVAGWLREDSGGDALKLLESLDVETHAGVGLSSLVIKGKGRRGLRCSGDPALQRLQQSCASPHSASLSPSCTPGAAVLALEGLLESGALDASALSTSAAAEGRGLRAAAAAAQEGAGGKAVLEPAEALMWWVTVSRGKRSGALGSCSG